GAFYSSDFGNWPIIECPGFVVYQKDISGKPALGTNPQGMACELFKLDELVDPRGWHPGHRLGICDSLFALGRVARLVAAQVRGLGPGRQRRGFALGGSARSVTAARPRIGGFPLAPR